MRKIKGFVCLILIPCIIFSAMILSLNFALNLNLTGNMLTIAILVSVIASIIVDLWLCFFIILNKESIVKKRMKRMVVKKDKLYHCTVSGSIYQTSGRLVYSGDFEVMDLNKESEEDFPDIKMNQVPDILNKLYKEENEQ